MNASNIEFNTQSQHKKYTRNYTISNLLEKKKEKE